MQASFFSSPKGLNVSSVDFHPTPDPLREEALQARLREAAALLRERPAERAFALLDGPPYANGLAHAGHLLNRALKDFAVRAHALSGWRVSWRPGWDCHGLPLELAVERRHGAQTKREPAAFARLAREEASLWVEAQSRAFDRLGTLAEADRAWLTMDPQQEARALGLALELFEEGLLEADETPVHWCPACRSALAASELEPLEHSRLETAFLARLEPRSALEALRAAGLPLEGAVSLPCWTSAPWTLWGSAAYAFEADAGLALAERGDGSWLLLPEAALEAARAALGEGLPLRAVLPASSLQNTAWLAQKPLGEGLNPLLPSGRDLARAEEGLGWTHLAPRHGPEDHDRCRPLGLDGLECLGEDGRACAALAALEPRAAGLGLRKLARLGADRLREEGRLVWARETRHEGQGCWRHKAPFFHRSARQWFLALNRSPKRGGPTLREAALSACAATRWLPEGSSAGAQVESMLLGRDRWCLSRSRLWGLPLPLHCDAQGRAHPDSAAMWRAFLPKAAQGGAVEAWSEERSPEGYAKEPFCLDVWFDSGAALFSALDASDGEPSWVSEGRDQTRGWFLASFLLCAWKRGGRPTAPVALCHGFCVGPDGRKLSKSEGAGNGAEALFSRWGADTLRLWAALADPGDDPTLSEAALLGAQKELRALRQALRFALMNAQPPEALGAGARLRPLDARFLREWADAEPQALELARAGRFEAALRLVCAFCRRASALWFDAAKDALYLEPLASPARQAAACALGAFFERLAPLCGLWAPFSAEEAWALWRERAPGRESLAALASLGEAGPAGGLWALARSEPWPEQAERALALRAALGPQAERLRESHGAAAGLRSPLAGQLRDAGFSAELVGRLLGAPLALGPDEAAPEGWLAAADAVEADAQASWLLPPAGSCPRCRRRFALAGVCARCERQLSGASALGLAD
jgi:isoleucyl-tRNA synthetase